MQTSGKQNRSSKYFCKLHDFKVQVFWIKKEKKKKKMNSQCSQLNLPL